MQKKFFFRWISWVDISFAAVNLTLNSMILKGNSGQNTLSHIKGGNNLTTMRIR